jgi:Tol biopolymer transport system component
MSASEDKVAHLWHTDEHGENGRQLTSGTGEQLMDVSPDGQTVLFFRGDDPDFLWRVSADGGAAVQLGPSAQFSARFSPDGSLISHTAIRAVNGQGTFIAEIIPMKAGEPRRTPTVPQRMLNARWLPDGSGASYSHASNEFKNLYRVHSSDKSPQEITRFTEGRITQHEWSPDGKRLLLLRQTEESPTKNIWMTNADGSKPVALTDFQTGDITDMKWSRDGRRVYFTYGESSQNVVMIRNFR